MSNRNPFAFFEDLLRPLKEKLGGSGTPYPHFDGNFIREINAELTVLLQWCAELDQDTAFVKKINNLTDPDHKNPHYYKTSHFFLSDVIGLWEQLSPKANKRSLFVLAAYYDALKNQHFSDESAVAELNLLVADPEFEQRLKTIRASNRLPDPGKVGFFITSATEEHKEQQPAINFIGNFTAFAFQLKFKNENEARSFLQTEKKVSGKKQPTPETADSLEKVLKELDSLIGLENVKKDIRELINVLKIQKKREKEGLKNIDLALHTVFLGPPGTGKTTVARLMSRIYFHLGFLSKGHFYETDREGLIAGYVGQTAIKVDKAVEESKGGVLFIDEAYGLTQADGTNDYGAEAINSLLKRMEDYRDDLVVIVAGYTEPMKMFLDSNPGLRSRFARFFLFEHLAPEDLLKIFISFCKKSDFTLTADAREKLLDTFEMLYEKRDEGFGNARVVRNLFEKCAQNQANRLVKLKKLTPKLLKTLDSEDIPEPKETVNFAFFGKEE